MIFSFRDRFETEKSRQIEIRKGQLGEIGTIEQVKGCEVEIVTSVNEPKTVSLLVYNRGQYACAKLTLEEVDHVISSLVIAKANI